MVFNQSNKSQPKMKVSCIIINGIVNKDGEVVAWSAPTQQNPYWYFVFENNIVIRATGNVSVTFVAED